MKAAIVMNHSEHQRSHGAAMQQGLICHGIETSPTSWNTPIEEADVHVVWGITRQRRVIDWSRRTARPILVMERGHVGDRMHYCSLGWDGLGRHGHYPTADDEGRRWNSLWGYLESQWRHDGRYALVIGQVPGDSALAGLLGGFQLWAQRQIEALRVLGWAVRFRPHPVAVLNGYRIHVTGAAYSTRQTLAEDLADAALCVTYNSTSGVAAVLAGVPTITLDEGAMAWDMSGHALEEHIRPDRTQWMHNLAFTQWSLDEIADGTAWEQLRTVVYQEV